MNRELLEQPFEPAQPASTGCTYAGRRDHGGRRALRRRIAVVGRAAPGPAPCYEAHGWAPSP